MRWALLATILCGCTNPHRSSEHPDARDQPTADAPDNPGDGLSWRPTTAAIANSSIAAWSRGDTYCPLEGGPICTPPEPTLLVADLASGTPRTLVETLRGIKVIGDQNELFYFDLDDDLSYLVRVRPMESPPIRTAMSVPHAFVRNLVVDANYVYWFEANPNGDPGRLRRASRTGDGSDAITIPGTGGSETLFAGYFWTAGCTNAGCTVIRTPVTGGAAEQVSTEGGWIVGADDTALYISQPETPSGYRQRVIAMSADGTIQPLTEFMLQGYAPFFFALSGSEMFWSTTNSEFYRLPRSGGTPTRVEGLSTIDPFAVTADAILYDFTADSYKSWPL